MRKGSLIYNTLFVLLVCLVASCNQTDKPQIEQELEEVGQAFYAIEIHGQLCGYKDMTCDRVLTEQGVMCQLKETSHLRMNLLGKQVFTKGKNEGYYDTTFQHLIYSQVSIDQGGLRVRNKIVVQGDTARITSSSGQETRKIILPNGIHFENGMYKPQLVAKLTQNPFNPLDIQVFEEIKARMVDKSYSWKGRDTLLLAEKRYNTIRVKELNRTTGEHSELWLEESSGLIVKGIFHTSNYKFFIATRDIANRLVSARVDDILFYQVHEIIPDFKELSFMKVKMKINSSGELLSVESLNYPGQKFNGTVENNIIDGVFEISQPRFDGANAPGYPYDYTVDSAMQKYLEPEFLIESDDPKILAKAEKITGNEVTDSWDAVKKLSHWVGTRIKGAIPGGGSAVGTLKTMKGECGGHSRLLAAFCRSLGIPARLSIGCMYVPDNGGFFGQHAWTEVYMGEAGWIPVDATIQEFDYIDSGHIRLGEGTSFHPKEVKILEYETNSGAKQPESMNK
ncbi:MAG: transglutaminase domain-containing protein [Bacteroidales bacterium]|nr:transglutaminase domain-containing protein [Bacteroidota bacterium]MBL6949635.1 transglutaminase domain-containing protein [Bacteroidales bacterium]